MPERTLLRTGSVLAIVGGVLAVLVNALHPRVSDPTDVEAELRMIADSGIWRGDHIGILFAVLLVTGGLVALYRSIIDEPGATWARLGFASALVSGGLGLAVFAHDGIAMKAIADAWAAAPEANRAVAVAAAEMGLAGFSVWIIAFLGVTFVLYGLAVALSAVYPKWLGWVAVVAGVGAGLVGLVQAYEGPSVLVTNVLFAVFSIVITIWIIVMGVLVWRRAGAAGALP